MGQNAIIPKGDLASTFPIFGESGTYLRVLYDLAFLEGLDLSKLNLPVKDSLGSNGWSSQSYPIARLHYTLSVAS